MTDDPSNRTLRDFLNSCSSSVAGTCEPNNNYANDCSCLSADLLTSASPARRVHSSSLILFVVAEVDPGHLFYFMSFTVDTPAAGTANSQSSITQEVVDHIHTKSNCSPIPIPKMPARTIPFSRVMSAVDYRSMHFVVCDCPTETTLPLYVEELKSRQVTDVVRVCEPTYDKSMMEENGIKVHDWPFADGTIPPNNVIMNFLQLCDDRFTGGIAGVSSHPESDGPAPGGPCIAIHCVAGLGRAPALVAISLIEAGMQPLDAVEFVRRRRRGAFNSIQLTHLVDCYKKMWKSRGAAKFFSTSSSGGAGRRPSSPTFGRRHLEKGGNEEEPPAAVVGPSQGVRAKTSFMKVFGGFAGRKATSQA
ncbi:Protein tyrosine phosphatase type IVA 3 [Dinochytrium kinnereticum]|nr:Protein tyrosine phosphatase type IVA 3 [Dinochytrium kinnereticum]